MSPSHRATDGNPKTTATFSVDPKHSLPRADSRCAPLPDSRRHSPVCSCQLCEQRVTGEQAMRSARGNYRRFLKASSRRKRRYRHLRGCTKNRTYSVGKSVCSIGLIRPTLPTGRVWVAGKSAIDSQSPVNLPSFI
jgi:hypothetical protein